MSVDVAQMGSELCNWGRWGDDDEQGTVNYIGAATVVRAAGHIETGKVIELGVSLGRPGPEQSGPRRFDPLHFMMLLPTEDIRSGEVGIADDVLVLPLQAATQWDALAHVAHRGMLYGGRDATEVSSAGAAVNSIRAVSGRIAGRGVLLDVARSEGVASLPPGFAVEVEHLERSLAAQDTTVMEGDILLVRTGHLERCRQREWAGFSGDAPGLGMRTLPWIHERRIAAVATDTAAVEVKPYQVPDHSSPFHAIALVYMGLLLGEVFDMERLAADCADDRRYEFFFTAPPLPVSGAVGSPINPYAVK